MQANTRSALCRNQKTVDIVHIFHIRRRPGLGSYKDRYPVGAKHDLRRLSIHTQELIMQNPKTLMRAGVIGTVLVALCCFTPVLVILLGVVGLSALTGYLDYVLLPALIAFFGLTIYAVWRKQKADACCPPTGARRKND